MPRRYCMSPVIGDGTEANPYRAAVAAVPGLNHVAVIPSLPDGSPRFAWCLTLVAGTASALTTAGALTGVRPLPNIGKDVPLSSAPAAQRVALRAALDEWGLADLALETTRPFRVLLRALGRRLDANFDEDTTGVSE